MAKTAKQRVKIKKVDAAASTRNAPSRAAVTENAKAATAKKNAAASEQTGAASSSGPTTKARSEGSGTSASGKRILGLGSAGDMRPPSKPASKNPSKGSASTGDSASSKDSASPKDSASEASSGKKNFTFDWGKAPKETKGQLRQLVRDGDKEGYAKLATEKLGMSDEEAAHWFQNEVDLSKRRATTGSSRPASGSSRPASGSSRSASGSASETGGRGSPGKSAVVAGAKKKSGTFGSLISGWDDATKRSYSDLVSRANKGDTTARGILFSGTKDGGKNKFGMTRQQVVTGLSYAERTGHAIKGYEGGRGSATKAKSSASSADPSEIVSDSGFFGSSFESPSATARRRASDPSRKNTVVGQLGANVLTPGGALAWASSKISQMPKERLHKIATVGNTVAAAAAAADGVYRAGQAAYGGIETKDQDWTAVEYLNPLMWAATLGEKAGRALGDQKYPVAEPTQFAIDQENRRKEFDELIARASRTVDTAGNPVNGADFRVAFNRVRARYADAVAAAGKLGGEELRMSALDRARSQANASLAALAANKPFMDASYVQGDLAAVNKALKAAGYADDIDDLGAAEEFIANADGDEAARAKFMDVYRKTMTDRSAMSPVDRLGW